MKSIKALAAKDIMHRDVVRAHWNMTIPELERLFEEKRITGAPVVDDFGKLMGVVSETDIVRFDTSHPRQQETPHTYFKAIWEEGESPAEREESEDCDVLKEKTVEDIMTPWTVSAHEETPISEVARMMVDRRVHRVLVVGDDLQLRGIITSMDIARVVAEGIAH